MEQLCARVCAEAGRLDVLVNDIWGGDALTEWGRSFWALSIAQDSRCWSGRSTATSSPAGTARG